MFIPRDLEKALSQGRTQVPVLALIGPRQSGKSTLAKKIFKDHAYIDMQDANATDFAQADPKGFLNSYKNDHGIIIDEAQYAPALFSQIKVEVDRHPEMRGYFILSGSQNFLLHEKISESLAGRVYLYTLLPLSIIELKNSTHNLAQPIDQIIAGFYPRIYQPSITTKTYYDNYSATYVERDIRSLRNIENITLFQKFMQLCCLSIGTTINFSNLARDCGITVSTVKSWLSLLETSYILFLLPSYHNNLGKRLTKSPKLYFYDIGLATALMGIDKEAIIKNRQLYGALFENMIIVDLMKNYYNRGMRPPFSFLRDSNNNEIDLIIEHKGSAVPIEIKASETVQTSFFTTMNWFCEHAPTPVKPYLFYGGNTAQNRSYGIVLPWDSASQLMQDLFAQ